MQNICNTIIENHGQLSLTSSSQDSFGTRLTSMEFTWLGAGINKWLVSNDYDSNERKILSEIDCDGNKHTNVETDKQSPGMYGEWMSIQYIRNPPLQLH